MADWASSQNEKRWDQRLLAHRRANEPGVVFDTSTKDFTAAGVWMLAVLLVLLSAVLVILVIHILYRRRHVREQEIAARNNNMAVAASTQAPDEAAMRERIERRYETIEGWIISKRVLLHDEFCALCVHPLANKGQLSDDEVGIRSMFPESEGTDLEAPTAGEPSTSSTTSSPIECPICFEELQCDDIVSFSPNAQCSHLFHHECIKEWLLRHTACPICRNYLMHTDLIRKYPHESFARQMQGYQLKHSQRSATTICCVQSGLIEIPTQVSCTSQELEELTRRIRSSIVDQKVLSQHRKTMHNVKTTIQQLSESDENSNNSNPSDRTPGPNDFPGHPDPMGEIIGGGEEDVIQENSFDPHDSPQAMREAGHFADHLMLVPGANNDEEGVLEESRNLLTDGDTLALQTESSEATVDAATAINQ